MATVRYIVNDVDAALAFYAVLGFELSSRPGPPIAIARKGDLELWISGPGASASRKLSTGAKPEPGGWNRFVVEVADLDAAMNDLKAKGCRFRADPITGPGGRQVLCEDPSGNPVELFEPGD
jgi:catechol 2,3-dioxygenase-like lactoylglutathione lyase family enzyme